MALRGRSPSVESRRRSDRKASPHREKSRRSTSPSRRRNHSPTSRREPHNLTSKARHSDSHAARDHSKDRIRRRSRDRSPAASSHRPSGANLHRPDPTVTHGRRRESSIPSGKRRRQRSPSLHLDEPRKVRRQGSPHNHRPTSPDRRLDRTRRPSPDSHFSRRPSPSRDLFHRSSRRPIPSDDQRPTRPRSPDRSHKHWEDKKKKSRDIRVPHKRRSLSRESRAASPGHRTSHPIAGRPPHSSRRGNTPPHSFHGSHRRKFSREEELEYRHSRPSSRSPRRGPYSRRHSEERGRRGGSDSARDWRGSGPKPRGDSRGSKRSPSPRSDRERDDKMSWRPPFDQNRQPASRGGWSSHDPRYSHSPPAYNQGYHNGTPQPGYSPQQSPYANQSGHPDRGYFSGSPPYNQSHSNHPTPAHHHSSPQTPNGTFPSRGGYRGSQGAFNQRYDSRFPPPALPASAPGPHVRNLSWTPKTGTRGGHAPTLHGANAAQIANADTATAAQAEQSKSASAENPFRPASKELRVDDEAGKAGKGPADESADTKADSQQSPSIRFGLPKPGAQPAAAKPNPFQIKKNPLESLTTNGHSAERRDSRTSSRQDDRSAHEDRKRREEPPLPPKKKGPKPALKHSVNKTFYDRRKAVHNVSWGRMVPGGNDRELRVKLQKLRTMVLSKGHSVKELQWAEIRPLSESFDNDDLPGLREAFENKCTLEEEAYRRHPKNRPKDEMPKLKEGEVLDTVFKKEVVAVKYKIRRPQKILPEEYRTSNVYYRKPGNESVVGFGTYGKVFKAKHIYKGEDVALKRLRMEAEKDGFPITAMREMKILKHLEQREAEGVIRLHELLYEVNFQNSVACFMVFEYMPHDLTGLLNHPTFKLTTSQKKDMAQQIIDAIGFMHRQGVIHRDIKAANILVSHQGEIKVADFGLARFYDMDRQLHYTNRVVTIWYRAPELLYGQTEYGPAIDVWATACVIVEIFTRHAIFPGNGKDLNQLLKVWEIMGFPTPEEWPGVSKTEWYFMMRPKEAMPNIFKEKYSNGDLGKQTTPELLNLLADMLNYDPGKRPTCNECLQHPFFTIEEPQPERVTTELETLGDWHEFESKKAKRAKEAEDRVDKDLKDGPPSCGQFVKDERRDRGYRRDLLLTLRQDKRQANFSPTEPEAKKIRI